jgi:hypothetical protein
VIALGEILRHATPGLLNIFFWDAAIHEPAVELHSGFPQASSSIAALST